MLIKKLIFYIIKQSTIDHLYQFLDSYTKIEAIYYTQTTKAFVGGFVVVSFAFSGYVLGYIYYPYIYVLQLYISYIFT